MARVEVDPDQVRMSFGEHLDELRRSLLHAIYGALVAVCIALYYGNAIFSWLMQPLVHSLAVNGYPARVVASRVTTGFGVYMKIGLIAGLIIAGPWVLYQLWKFVSTGLYASERRIVVLLAPFSGAMTVLGVLFLYYVILPLALAFLIGFNRSYPLPEAGEPTIADKVGAMIVQWTGGPKSTNSGAADTRPNVPVATQPDQVPTVSIPFVTSEVDRELARTSPRGRIWVRWPDYELRVSLGPGEARIVPLTVASAIDPFISADDYLDFVLWMGLALAVAFQLPVVMLIMGWTRLIDSRTLSKMRKYVILGCFAVSAVLTPTGDPFNMALLALPLWGLFEFGLVLMRLTFRREGESEQTGGAR